MTETYSIASDFGGTVPNLTQLTGEIDADATVVTSLNYIDTAISASDNVDIVFMSTISPEEKTELDTLVSNHIPNTNPPKKNFFTYIPTTHMTKNSTYTRLGKGFKYGGYDAIGTINYVDVISYKDSSPTSYSIRLFDKTNSNVIAEITGLINTSESISQLGLISNVPSTEAIFEIQAKRVGGIGSKNVYVDQVIIYYDN